jgi:hypothetical protein
MPGAVERFVTGSLTIDDETVPEEGYGQLSQVKVKEQCK